MKGRKPMMGGEGKYLEVESREIALTAWYQKPRQGDLFFGLILRCMCMRLVDTASRRLENISFN